MAKAGITKTAQLEYLSIVNYLEGALGSSQAAHNFKQEFRVQMMQLRDMPELFSVSAMPELAAKGYRIVHINNYLAVYKLKGDTVYVAHVFHQSQNYARYV